MRLATRKYVDQFLNALESSRGLGAGALSFVEAARLAVHAILIGSLLSIVTGWLHTLFNGRVPTGVEKKVALENDALVASASVVYICVGMAVVMILIEDNLARAFAIGAAIALVRFRVKMAGKFLGIATLYGVLTGMACGVGRVDIAWGLAAVFMVLLGALLFVRSCLRKITPGRGREAGENDARPAPP